MKKFKSVNALVWWLQNNGGGEVSIIVEPTTSDDAIKIAWTNSFDVNKAGSGKFLSAAIADMEKGA